MFIVPESRELTIVRELHGRLKGEGISFDQIGDSSVLITSLIKTDPGPFLAVTSWEKILSLLELETANDQNARNDLQQLKALCELADSNAFLPISSEEITNQRMPAFILQLDTIVQESIQKATTQNILNTKGLKPQASWNRIGQYAYFTASEIGIWLGIHFEYWRVFGQTPLWILFSSTNFGRAEEVWPLVEPWAMKNGIRTSIGKDGELQVGIKVETGEEKDSVEESILTQLTEIAQILSGLRKSTGNASPD